MKKYWKLILKKENELDDKKTKYNKHFRKEITQKEIVTYLINTIKHYIMNIKYIKDWIKQLKHSKRELNFNSLKKFIYH